MMKWITPVLLLLALAHILWGFYGFYAPDAMAQLVGFEMTTTGARGEMRAVFGGLVGALGVAILRGSIGGKGRRQWLWAVATAYVGLACGRLISLGMDGMSAHTLFAGLFEVGLAILLFWIGMEVGNDAQPVPMATTPPRSATRTSAARPGGATGPDRAV
jgi:hypothetical protein